MTYLILFLVAFIQNMAFTFVSRSRNSGNPKKHFIAAIASNSIWFACNFFILFPEVLKTVLEGNLADRLIVMGIYTLATSLGSVVMMKINLGHWYVKYLTEEGKSQVGKRKD